MVELWPVAYAVRLPSRARVVPARAFIEIADPRIRAAVLLGYGRTIAIPT